MSTVTTSTKDTRAAVASLAKVAAEPTEAQVVATVNAADKVAGALALTIARYADQHGMSHRNIGTMLSKAGAPRAVGSIANDIRTGRILDRMIATGYAPTLDDVRAAVSLGNASEEDTKTIAAAVPTFATAKGAELAKVLPQAKEQRSAIRSAVAKAAAAAKVTKENTSGTPVPPKATTPAKVATVTVSGTNAEKIEAATALLARIDSALGLTAEQVDALTAQTARVAALLASLPPVTKATKAPAPASA